MHIDEQYKNLVEDILENGEWKENRTGIRTKSIFGTIIKANLADGFPILTTRKCPIKSTWVELNGFLHGITDKNWYQERGCEYWSFWCRPDVVTDLKGKEKEQAQLEEKDLGPIYGYQWRMFGQDYVGLHPENWTNNGIFSSSRGDQLYDIVQNIKTGNDNRRLICSAWNPNQAHLQALPPCHVLFQANITNGKLNLLWYQRSVDTACGLPANIASYATLTHLLAREGNLQPGTLTGFLGDTHIYENHIEQLKQQISRPHFTLPSLEFQEYGDIFSWTYDKCTLKDYKSGEKMKYEVAI